MKNIKTFESFLFEQETKLITDLPKEVILGGHSGALKPGVFTVDLDDQGDLTISYDRDANIYASLDFNKTKTSYGDGGVKGDGLSRAEFKNLKAKEDSDRLKSGKPYMDPKANAGKLLDDFWGFSGQYSSDKKQAYMDTFSKILRTLSVSEKFKTRVPQSFKDFMSSVYSFSSGTDIFASTEINKIKEGKDLVTAFKKGMETANKEIKSAPKKA